MDAAPRVHLMAGPLKMPLPIESQVGSGLYRPIVGGSFSCAVAHPVTHENEILVLFTFRDQYRNRPLGIDIFDSYADTDSDPEVSRFLALFSGQG
jgi:hypothetical protein